MYSNARTWTGGYVQFHSHKPPLSEWILSLLLMFLWSFTWILALTSMLLQLTFLLHLFPAIRYTFNVGPKQNRWFQCSPRTMHQEKFGKPRVAVCMLRQFQDFNAHIQWGNMIWLMWLLKEFRFYSIRFINNYSVSSITKKWNCVWFFIVFLIKIFNNFFGQCLQLSFQERGIFRSYL